MADRVDRYIKARKDYAAKKQAVEDLAERTSVMTNWENVYVANLEAGVSTLSMNPKAVQLDAREWPTAGYTRRATGLARREGRVPRGLGFDV